MYRAIYVFIWSLLLSMPVVALGKQESLKPKTIEHAKKATVTIRTNVSMKAYGFVTPDFKEGGCIVDGKQGIILTTRRVVQHASVSTYQVTFHNGEQAEAKLCYYDPWLDYAFLKVAPQAIPTSATTLTLSAKDPLVNQPIFSISNNGGKSVSVHKGTISNIHNIIGSMPQHTINVSFETKQEAVGVPILNYSGAIVGLNYAGSETFGVSLHPAYIQHALKAIRKGKRPIRKHIGIVTDMYSLSDAVKYRNFPKKQLKAYVKRFPTSMGSAIEVVHVLKGTPAHGKLLPGDIIWAANKQPVGPDLVMLDMAMSQDKYRYVCLTIFRHGQQLEVNIPLYNLEDHTIRRMVSFGGALFFEADDVFSDKTGIAAGKLTFSSAQTSGMLSRIPSFKRGGTLYFLLDILAVEGKALNNLDQLIQRIPELIKQRYFTFEYCTMLPMNDSLSPLFGQALMQRHVLKADIAYDKNTPAPKLYTFNPTKMEWESQPIALE